MTGVQTCALPILPPQAAAAINIAPLVRAGDGPARPPTPPREARAANTVIAYEPVWAIGSGLTPTPADVAEVHGFIRGELGRLLGQAEAGALRLLYGGSVKPANASELLFVPDVDGALVGGASLKASDFYAILSAYAGRGAG